MRRASEILLLIGSILAFVIAGLFLLLSLAYLVVGYGALHNELAEALKNGSIHATSMGREMTVDEVELVFLIVGYVFLALAPLCLAIAIVGLMTKKKRSRGLYIASMVLGALFAPPLTFLGGLFGILSLPSEPKVAE